MITRNESYLWGCTKLLVFILFIVFINIELRENLQKNTRERLLLEWEFTHVLFFDLWDRKVIIYICPVIVRMFLVINYLLLLFRSICEFSTEEASPFLFKRYQQNYKVYSEQYVTVYFHFKRKRKASSKNWIKGACWRRSSKWLNDPK